MNYILNIVTNFMKKNKKIKNTFLLFIFAVIINSLVFSQNRNISEDVKKEVSQRDGGKCKCCGSTYNIEYDHIVPYSKGGSNKTCNIQLLCQTCNRSKNNNCCCKVHNKKLDIGSCDIPMFYSPNTNNTTTKSNNRPSTQCTAYTKKGDRCKNKTTNFNGRCNAHQ